MDNKDLNGIKEKPLITDELDDFLSFVDANADGEENSLSDDYDELVSFLEDEDLI